MAHKWLGFKFAPVLVLALILAGCYMPVPTVAPQPGRPTPATVIPFDNAAPGLPSDIQSETAIPAEQVTPTGGDVFLPSVPVGDESSQPSESETPAPTEATGVGKMVFMPSIYSGEVPSSEMNAGPDQPEAGGGEVFLPSVPAGEETGSQATPETQAEAGGGQVETAAPPVEAATPQPETAAPQATEASKALPAASVDTNRFVLQGGTPSWTSNFARPEAGCNWTGVVGQVFGRDNQPIAGMVVQVVGRLKGEEVLALGLTGSSKNLGPGGFEIGLAEQAVDSQGTLYMQLFDLNGAARSDVIPLNTYADCERNVIMVNFVQANPPTRIYFPIIP